MSEFAVIILVVLIGIFVTISNYFFIQLILEKDLKKFIYDEKKENKKLIFQIKLQAYERLILLLERISPPSLILRAQNVNDNVITLQSELLSIIRNEYEYNISQQMYISKEAWDLVSNAKEQVIKIINISANNLPPDATGNDLCAKIITSWIQINPTPTKIAIDYLKEEVKKLFNV